MSGTLSPEQQGMINAREGVVFFWSRIDPVANRKLLLGLTFDGIKTAKDSAKDISEGIKDIGKSVAEAGAETVSKLKEWATKLVGKIGEVIGFTLDLPWINWIAENLVGRILPFLGDITDGVKGLWQFGKAVVDKLKLWWRGRHVELVPGHPQTMAEGINKLVTNALLEGAYKVAKAAVSAGLKFVSMGVSAIVGAIAGVIEFIIRLVYTVIEGVNIDKFTGYCRDVWGPKTKEAKETRQFVLSGEAKEFNGTFLKYTKRAPVIAAITCNTNLAGDKKRLMRMYADDGSIISQSQFDVGCKYLETLKSTGRKYCQNWAKRMKTSDALAQLSLTLVQKGEVRISW